jgi:hypothetical protein
MVFLSETELRHDCFGWRHIDIRRPFQRMAARANGHCFPREPTVADSESVRSRGGRHGDFEVRRWHGGNHDIHFAFEAPIHVKTFGVQFIVRPSNHEAIQAVLLRLDRYGILKAGPVPPMSVAFTQEPASS